MRADTSLDLLYSRKMVYGFGNVHYEAVRKKRSESASWGYRNIKRF